MAGTSTSMDSRALMIEALRKLDRAQARIAELELGQSEPIAVTGIGCRFPGGVRSPSEFWSLLQSGGDAIGDIPRDRWNVDALYDPEPGRPGKMYVRQGGFLSQLDHFDASFFGISPREASAMDPQQRLWLEVCWEALEHANLVPAELFGKPAGVFVGISSLDFGSILTRSLAPEEIDPYLGTSASLNMAAGRLSYLLGLTGPSMAVDTACSSSLTAVHLACQSLRQRDCHLALAGGVNVILMAETYLAFCRARMLAPDGRCKAFDARADGFIRSEGCGVLVLKRLADARRDGDSILAVIRGSAVNQDGASGGLTVPSGPSQQEVIERALRNAGVKPSQVGYVEAHGTGTPLGDPIEMRSLGHVFGRDPERKEALIVGSVKSNIGHLEAAAGIAGLIKTVLALQNQAIPRHLHFAEPSPHIAWNELNLRVASEASTWSRGGKPRIAGVSSFGLSGSNAHVVVEEAPLVASSSSGGRGARLTEQARVLVISAKSEEAVRELASAHARHLANPESNLADLVRTVNTRRTAFRHRLSFVASSREEMRMHLDKAASGKRVIRQSQGTPKIGFLFTGQGSQRAGMGRELYEQQSEFRAAIVECSRLMSGELGLSLEELMWGAQQDKLGQTQYAQPALFALGYGLSRMWRTFGVTPTVVLGHSIGEFAAACVAGVLSLEDAAGLVTARGRLMQALDRDGTMVAVVGAGAFDSIRRRLPVDGVWLGSINGPGNVVLTGRKDPVFRLKQVLEEEGLRCVELEVSHAFHSGLMAPMVGDFGVVARRVAFGRPSTDLIPTGGGKMEEGASYWEKQILEPVRFWDGMKEMDQRGVEVFLELGPRPVLLGMGRECVSRPAEKHWLSSLKPRVGEMESVLRTAGELFESGTQIQWDAIEKDLPGGLIRVPTYPFQRKRFWIENAPTSSIRNAAGIMKLEAVASIGISEVSDLVEAFSRENDFPRDKLREFAKRLLGEPRTPDADGTLEDCFYQLSWLPQQLDANLAVRRFVGTLVIFDDCSATGAALQSALESAEIAHFIVRRGDAFDRLGQRNWSIRPEIRPDYEQLLNGLAGEREPVSFVYLWGLDGSRNGLVNPACVELQRRICEPLMLLIQALVSQSFKSRIWIVTRGVQSDGNGFWQSTLWGLGRTLMLEHPEFTGGLIDLPSEESEADGGSIAGELCGNDSEDQVRFANGVRSTARLLPLPVARRKDPFGARSDGIYLVTGGLGALGLDLADWLVSKGARHLILTGRRGPSTDVVARLDRMRGAGVEVEVIQADLSDDSSASELFTKIRSRSLPVRGIIHAAGVTGNERLSQMSWEVFAKVIKPKLSAWRIHEFGRNLGLDFLLLISSLASVCGAERQSHYAAGNHFLDALAVHGHDQGMPVFSVNLGPVRQGGMLDETAIRELSRLGFGSVEAGEVTEAIERQLGDGIAQLMFARLDRERFRSVYQARARSSWLGPGFSRKPADSPAGNEKAVWMEGFSRTAGDQQLCYVTQFLLEEAARVLRLQPLQVTADQSLQSLGLDSLVAVEFRDRIRAVTGVELKASRLLGGSACNELARDVLDRIPGVASAAAGMAQGTQDLPVLQSFEAEQLSRLDGMDESEMNALLEQLASGSSPKPQA